MTHLARQLPREIELGAVRRSVSTTEIVKTDGGYEVRNNRRATAMRGYDVSFPPSLRTEDIYMAVIELWNEAEQMLHTFDFWDWTDDAIVRVRFDSDLEITGLATHLDHIETFSLIEVFE